MKTTSEFYCSARAKFPELAEKADREHVKYWGEAPTVEESAYVWFESVSRALNNDMRGGAFIDESGTFFQFVADVLRASGEDVKRCIDASFVENLFWQVSPRKAAPYWQRLPQELKRLYLDFHSHSPT
jgi:hypothetical protein